MLLLRHASAGSRLKSPTIDSFRRLDEDGRAEARQLVWELADHSIDRIVSSPLPRCVETVVPLSESRNLVVEVRDELAPDALAEEALALLEELPPTAIVCTHREVFERLFEDEAPETGGGLVLERQDGEFVAIGYVPPPSTAAVGERSRVLTAS